MVCDHCHGHSLPSDKSPLRHQCQLSNTPCIHRWHEDSLVSKDRREDPECRHAHSDCLPLPDGKDFSRSGRVILLGKQRAYLVDGRVPKLACRDENPPEFGL